MTGRSDVNPLSTLSLQERKPAASNIEGLVIQGRADDQLTMDMLSPARKAAEDAKPASNMGLVVQGGADDPTTMATFSPVRLRPEEIRRIMGGADINPAPITGGTDVDHVLYGMFPEELSLLQDTFHPSRHRRRVITLIPPLYHLPCCLMIYILPSKKIYV